MRHTVTEQYVRAGIARRSGKGLMIEIAGAGFYITPDEMPALMGDRPAEVVNRAGENEGTAWLSPLVSPRKMELTAMIRKKLYVLAYRDMNRLLSGACRDALVREFIPC